jgi:DNA polymerase III subunit beta
MNIVCTQENLKNGLMVVGRVIGTSSTLPILNNILLRTEEGQLKLSATNLELAVTTVVRCKIEEEGAGCVPAKIVNELVGALPATNITLVTVDAELLVTADHYTSKVKTLPTEEFPLIPVVERTYVVALPGQVLKQGLEQVLFAVSTSQTQPEISGVLLSLRDRVLTFVATDRYRLAEKRLQLPRAEGLKDVIIPAKTAQELVRIIGNYDHVVEVVLGETQIAVTVGDTTLVSRLVDGQYPDYEQIIPTEFTTQIVVPTAALVNAVKASAIFSRSNQSITMEYQQATQRIVIFAVSHEVGESRIEVPAVIEGSSGTIICNYRYLLEALAGRKEERVRIQIMNDTAPVLLGPDGDAEYRYLVMPIKV